MNPSPSQDAEGIRLEIREHCALICLDNPPANTWTVERLDRLQSLIDGLNQDPNIYSLIIHSGNPRFFSAGADLNLFASGDQQIAQSMTDYFGYAFEALRQFRGVSIAAIRGYAMGGGLEVALACDFRIAGRGALFALPETRVGLLPCAGGTQNLTRLVGESWSKRMILLGERLDTERALEIGLVDLCVDAEQVLEEALLWAAKVEEQSPQAIAACKRLIQQHDAQHWIAGYRQENQQFVALFDTEDQTEGVRAFLEKRTPQWKNR